MTVTLNCVKLSSSAAKNVGHFNAMASAPVYFTKFPAVLLQNGCHEWKAFYTKFVLSPPLSPAPRVCHLCVHVCAFVCLYGFFSSAGIFSR